MTKNIRKFVNLLTAGATASTILFMAVNSAVAQDDGFRTPSGNIYCLIYGDGLQCEMSENTAKLPPQPSDCNLDWGNRFAMTAKGTPVRACHGDTISGGVKVKVLQYGQTWRSSGFSCTSRTSGLTCTNQAKKGWFLSKNQQRFF